MKNQNYFQNLLLILLILFASQLVSFSQTRDTVRALPHINKKFMVVVHIVQDSSGNLAMDSSSIRNTVASVSSLFSPIGISFEVCDVRLISNYSYFVTDRFTAHELFPKYSLPNRLNLFVVGRINDLTNSVCGEASLGGVTTDKNVGVVMAGGRCATLSTLGHELGHFFNLEHTFEKDHGIELADGSNCSTAGDRLCDTPADPYTLGGLMTDYIKNCLFIFPQKDAKGNYYDPDLGNIMSYYPCNCNKFTRGQYEKMANYYLKNPLLW